MWEREEKRFELLKKKNQNPQQLNLPFFIDEKNKPKKGFFHKHFFPAGILGHYIKFPQKEALELFT